MAVAVLDIDGTLLDTNYHHTIAWYRAFRQHGIVLPLWRIHRHIGMGGDQLVGALTDERTESEQGEDIRAAEKVLYFELITEVETMEGSRELIEQLKRRGHTVVPLISRASVPRRQRPVRRRSRRRSEVGARASIRASRRAPSPRSWTQVTVG